jgi:hypothetical protein
VPPAVVRNQLSLPSTDMPWQSEQGLATQPVPNLYQELQHVVHKQQHGHTLCPHTPDPVTPMWGLSLTEG